jgi:threonine dehydrogenase-like Zn-dependent dehydrogenase
MRCISEFDPAENSVAESAMKAFVVHAGGGASLREVPVPVPGHDEALVRVTTASICATDLKILDGRLPVAPGRVLGHELVGEFVEGGPGSTGFEPGQRVFVPTNTPCGRCSECLGVANGLGCRADGSINGFQFGVLRDGGHAQYSVVPYASANLVPIPEGVSDEQAVMCCCVGTTGFGGVERSDLRLGDAVAIVGQGPVGMSATVAARLRGAALVVVVDGIAARRELALRMGADVALDPAADVVEEVARRTDGRMADVAIEAVGIQPTFELALRLTRPGGTLSSIGNYGVSDACLELPLDVGAFMGGIGDKRIVTTSAPGGKDRARRMLALVASGRFDPGPYVTHTFPLDEIETALELFRTKAEGVFKVAIKP